jgi:replicative DNA helicase
MDRDPEGLLCMRTFDEVRAADFYRPGHRVLAEWIQTQRATGRPVDMIALVTDCQANAAVGEIFAKAFGANYASTLVELSGKGTTTAFFDWQVGQIKQAAVKREAIAVCTDAITTFYEGNKTADLLLADLQDAIAAISFDFDTVKDEFTVTTEAWDELQSAMNDPTPRGYATGFHVLDSVMSVRPGEVVTIAARTSMGKTAFAAQLMDHFCNQAGGLFITKEMKSTDLVKRLMSKDIGKSVDKVSLEDYLNVGKINEAATKRQRRNRLSFRDCEVMNIAVVETMIRVYAMKGAKFFAIDYIQLMEATKETAKQDRRLQIADITRRIKQLALKLDVIILMVAQIARLNDNERPELKHLSESKTIEDDSDKVIFIHRALGSRQAEIKVAKDRSGPTSDWLDLGFEPETTSFKDLPRA